MSVQTGKLIFRILATVQVFLPVLGLVEPAKLGRTLTHEHLKLDYSLTLVTPPNEVADFLQGPITLENVGFVQRYP